MKKYATLLCLAFLLPHEALIAASPAASQNRYLQAELALARKNSLYTVFDLAARKISIKAAGITLSEISIQHMDLWGQYPESVSYALNKKSAFNEPERFEIDPSKAEEGETAANEIDALERSDMPTRYKLYYGDAVVLKISAEPEGIAGHLFSAVTSAQTYLGRPVIFLWKRVWGQTYTVIDIELKAVDAQSLYWTLAEGSAGLFHIPE